MEDKINSKFYYQFKKKIINLLNGKNIKIINIR